MDMLIDISITKPNPNTLVSSKSSTSTSSSKSVSETASSRLVFTFTRSRFRILRPFPMWLRIALLQEATATRRIQSTRAWRDSFMIRMGQQLLLIGLKYYDQKN
jgi:hypothetical protein